MRDQDGFILKDIQNVGNGGKMYFLLIILMMKIIVLYGFGKFH